MCLYLLISSASCCNFAKHLLDPLHGAASVQVGVWATAGDCGYSVPRLGILGASHGTGKHVSLPKTWSGQHLVPASMYWRCIGEGAAVSTPAPGLQTLHPPRLMISSWEE